MMPKARAYLISMALIMACLPVRTEAQQESVRLLYSFDVATNGQILGYAGSDTQIESFVYQKDEFGTTSLQLPAELAAELDTYAQGPESVVMRAIFVIRGSAKVWDCGFNEVGDWECNKVSH